ncbi:putative oxidoreductase YdhV [subsurface metagenome]
MVKGYVEKLLFIDLNNGTMKEETLGEEVSRSFIGNKGLGARMLYERMKPNVDPLGPDNMLGFLVGPLTGTGLLGASRFTVVTKSPLSGGIGDASCGGSFGHEMRRAGFDTILFTGISPKPVYLRLNDGKAELRDASDLWGKNTDETEEALRQELGDKSVKVACIGPAGEAKSLLASVMHEAGAAARFGVGAVMGSKRVKAVVVKGTQKVKIADPKQFEEMRKALVEFLRIKEEMIPALHQAHHQAHLGSKLAGGEAEEVALLVYRWKNWGTCGFVKEFIESGEAPIKNWQLMGKEYAPNVKNYWADGITKYISKKHSCFGCTIGCKGYVTVPKGSYAVSNASKPEYETLVMFGPMCLIDNAEAIIKANHLCNLYGIDTISVGTAIAFAMECYDRGVITKEDTDGIELTWGNAAAMVAMVEKVARREGFGAMLADGVKKAAERIGHGSEEWAIHIGGEEPPAHDPRISPAWGTVYMVDPTPSRHTAGHEMWFTEMRRRISPYPELYYPDAVQDDTQHKGQMYANTHNYHDLIASAGLCYFASVCHPGYHVIEFIAAVTGWDYTLKEGLETGRRIETVRQAFNLREGLRPSDFAMPKRITEPPTVGPFAGKRVDFDTTVRNYYKAMGWDPETAKPLESTLQELGLKELVGQLP